MSFRKRKADSDLLQIIQGHSDDEPVGGCQTAAVKVVGGRTFPGELARKIIAGYMNPRVIPPSASSVFGQGNQAYSRDPKSRRDYWPSRKQAFAVLAKCVPRHLEEAFLESLGRHHDAVNDSRSETVLPDAIHPHDAKICKIGVAHIHLAFVDIFGRANVTLEKCDHMNSDHIKHRSVNVSHILEIVVLDAVLARTKKLPRVLSSRKASVDTPVKMKVDDVALKDPEHDRCFRAFVAVLPEAGVFYCHRERRKEWVGVANTHVPLDINWLRIVKNGHRNNRFATGGYVTRLWGGDPDCIWKWKISRRSEVLAIPDQLSLPLCGNFDRGRLKSVHQVHQCADEDLPCLPPDFVHGIDRSREWTTHELRTDFLKHYVKSTTARRGCRHYVSGYLHRHIDPHSVWVIDPSVSGDADVNVAVHIRNPDRGEKVGLVRDSLIQIRFLPHLGSGALRLLNLIQVHAQSLRSSQKKGAVVRSGCGDLGHMHAIGTRICLDKRRRTQYVTSSAACEQPVLARCVRASAQLAALTIPAVLRAMQDVEDDSAILPRNGMAGDRRHARVSHSMDVSVDLSNASHYDVNDASQGFSIWTEDKPGSTKDWYFVLPNVFGKKEENGRTYNGMAIRLTHGVLISWDGRLIRHCTSMMNRAERSHVYGTFFAAKSSVVFYGMNRKIERHKRDIQRLLEQKIIASVSKECSEDDLASDDQRSVPLDPSDDESLEDSNSGDSTDDDGIDRCDIVFEHTVDTGTLQKSVSPVNAAVRSEVRIPRKQSSPKLPSLVLDLDSPPTYNRCLACDVLCAKSGGRRDALLFACHGGGFRTTKDPREVQTRTGSELRDDASRGVICRYLTVGDLDTEAQVRVYYASMSNFCDEIPPSQVTGRHLVMASRVLVRCPHLQFYIENFWSVLLPPYTTLRTGHQLENGVVWYYITTSACRTRYPHVLSFTQCPVGWKTCSAADWGCFSRAVITNVMVGVFGHCNADMRQISIESLTPGAFLGGRRIYFPTLCLRDLFARRFEYFLPPLARIHVGIQESDGSMCCPHGKSDEVIRYFLMELIPAPPDREEAANVVMMGKCKGLEDDCNDSVKHNSLHQLSIAVQAVYVMKEMSRSPRHGYFERSLKAAMAGLKIALNDLFPLAVRFAGVFDRICVALCCAMKFIPFATAKWFGGWVVSRFVDTAQKVIPYTPFVCDDVLLLRDVMENFCSSNFISHHQRDFAREAMTRLIAADRQQERRWKQTKASGRVDY